MTQAQRIVGMTRAQMLRALLAHGALGYAELVAVTGWTRKVVEHALAAAMRAGWVRRLRVVGCARWVYGVCGVAA
jgi:hypothetical protein